MAKPAEATPPEPPEPKDDDKDGGDELSTEQEKKVRGMIREEIGGALKDFFGEIEPGTKDNEPAGKKTGRGILQIFTGEM